MKKVYLLLALFYGSITVTGQQIKINAEVTMLALGDSYTIGESVDISGRWPHQFMDELRKLGVSGMYPDYIATTGWTTQRLIQAVKYRVDEGKTYNLVSILIGVNDQYQGIPIASYEPDLRILIDLALSVVNHDTSRVFILSIPDYAYTPFGGGNASISKEIDDYNQIKSRVAAEYRIAFIDITPISREGLNNTSLVAPDGLHPSEIQYRRWVEAIMPRLRMNQTLSVDGLQGWTETDVRIYPNPAGSTLHLDAPENISRISIYSATGNLVSDLMTVTRPVKIDLSNVEPGMLTLWIHFESDEKICRRILLPQ